MTQTRVDIVAKDQTARAFASVDGRLRGLSSSISQLTGLFGGLSAGLIAVGSVRALRGVIDAQDALSKMSQSTGIAVESLAGLQFAAEQSGTSIEQVSKGVRRFSRLILESIDGTDKYGRLIKALGLDLEALKQATPEEQFIALAGAIKNNVSEQERAVVVTALFGNEYAALVPLLSQGEEGLRRLTERGRELNPVTAESAAQSEKFNDNLDELSRGAGQFATQAANVLLPALVSITSEMRAAAEQGGVLQGAMAGLAKTAREVFSAVGGLSGQQSFADFFGDVGESLLGGGLLKFLRDTEKQADSTADALADVASPQTAASVNNFSETFRKLAQESKKTSESTAKVSQGLSEQERQAQATARRIQQLNSQYDPLIRRNAELAEITKLANQGLSQTAIENAQIEIINRYIGATTEAAESVQEIDDRTVQLGDTTQQVFDSNEQIVISSVRRMQGAIADGLFNFFDDGLKGMFNSVKSTLGRIVSEFASIRLLQATGLGSVLGGVATGAGASTGGFSGGLGLAGLASSGANLVSSGFGIPSFVGSAAVNAGQFLGSSALVDFGVGALSPELLSGAGGLAAGAGTAFASLAGPLAIAGVADFGLRQLFGDQRIGGIAGDALSYVPVIGTLINGLFGRGAPEFRREELVGTVGAEGFQGAFNTQFREKGGAFRSSRFSNFIADTDTGELLNRSGRLAESGNFPRGLLDSVGAPTSERALEIGKFLDETFTALADTLESTADVLGISKASLAGFNAELDLTSEKGEQLSQEQISGAIADISDQMVRELIPSIDQLSRSSESATDTLQRLSADFQAVESGFILAGESVADARSKAQGLGFESRANITDQFGGAGGLQAQLDSFFDNVLNESQQLEIVETRIQDVLQEVGIGFIPTLEQLTQAFQEGTPEIQALVLQYDDLIVQYTALREAAEGLADATEEAADREQELTRERAQAAERNAFTSGRRESEAGGLAPTIATTIQGRVFTADEIRAQQQASVEESERKLRSITQEQISRTNQAVSLLSEQLHNIEAASSFFDQFKEDALELAGTNFTAAREQVNAATLLARAGASIELIDTPELAQAIEKLKEDRSAFFSTRKEFEQERARTVSEIEELSLSGRDNAQVQIDLLTDQLNTLDKILAVQQQTLINIDGATGAPLDPSRLSDTDLQAQSSRAGRGLFEALRAQAGTTFNGAVRFADPFGQNESADAQALARFGNLLSPQALPGGAQSEAINALKDQIKELKQQLTTTATAQTNLFNLLAPIARDGDSLRVTTV